MSSGSSWPLSLSDAADTNLATHFSWVQRRTPGMQAVVADDLVMVDCGLPCDTFNALCRTRLGPTAAARIRSAIDWFARLDHPFSWWVAPGHTPANLGRILENEGLLPSETELAMAVRLSEVAPAPPLPDFRVRRVRTAIDLEVFARLSAANWDPPDVHVELFYERAAPVLLGADAPLWLYLGWYRDAAVATAELTVGGGVVGLYNISTQVPLRGRGYGSALTTTPLLEARAAGHGMAVLQASDQGARIYRRLGFSEFGGITEYKPRAS